MLTVDRLREVLELNVATGVFRWKIKRGSKPRGAIAGTISKKGYVVIGIDDHIFLGHRLVWLHVFGIWPPDELDHKDGNRQNNSITNLREATRFQNRANSTTVMSNKTSIYKGVSKTPRGRWKSQIGVNNKSITLGTFDNELSAHKAYCAAAEKYHGQFAKFS